MIDDTIAAIATAPGEAGIGIVRLSGPLAVDILDQVFVASKGKSIKDFPSRRLTHGYIVNPHTHDKVDEALVVYMKGPNTYTAEDVAEIDCHGGIVPVRKILGLVLSLGARMAEPGEFTKRAFLNGRIDLSQAEAVMDIISAKTEKGFDIALGQLEGSLSKEVGKIRNNVLEMIAHITVNIDFPDEDIEEITYQSLEKQAQGIVEAIAVFLSTAHTGKIIREGLKTVIIGKPNVGKSSLMNALLKESRAIVTEVPGTTRDVIEEYVSIQGIPLKIVDTAGIRETEDIVEKIGVERSKEFFNKSDLIIFVLNASEPLTEEDRQIIHLVHERDAIILLNKADLPMVVDEEGIQEMLPGKKVIKISVTEGIGLKELEDTIVHMVYGGQVKHRDLSLVTNVRHQNALERAKKSMEDAVVAIQRNMPLDFVEVDVRNCWQHLGEITGDTVGEDIIDQIFANFCLGK
jgi:tRNA modification GTPase